MAKPKKIQLNHLYEIFKKQSLRIYDKKGHHNTNYILSLSLYKSLYSNKLKKKTNS